MFLTWIIPLWSKFISSGFWSYFVLPLFCLALIVVFARLIINTVRYFSNV